MPPTPFVVKTAEEFILNGCYHIPFSRCNTSEAVASCASEVARQPWSSTVLVYAFIAAATDCLDGEGRAPS